MDYFLLFIEGLMTFVSPCLLPMLPMYIAFFAGDEESSQKAVVLKALAFIAGFSLVFIFLSLFVSTFGQFLLIYRQWVNFVAGLFIVILGIDYLRGQKFITKLMPQISGKTNYSSPFMFGILFAISWSPCVGTFLASALSYIATVPLSWKSFFLILAYCLGLGVPFFLSALLVEESKQVIGKIKANYELVHKVSGIFLIIFGLLTMSGFMERILLSLT